MMLALLRMDLAVMRRYLLISVPFYLGNAVLFGFHPGVYLVGHAALAVGLLLLTLMFEERDATLGVVASHPVSRRQIVSARYAWGASLAALCYGVGLLYNLGLTRWVVRLATDEGALVSRVGMLAYATSALLAIAVVLPLYYRNGLGIALAGLAVAGLIALTAISAVVVALSGSVWRYDQRAAIQSALGSLVRCVARSEIQVAWVVGLVLLVAVSIWQAARGLEAREL